MTEVASAATPSVETLAPSTSNAVMPIKLTRWLTPNHIERWQTPVMVKEVLRGLLKHLYANPDQVELVLDKLLAREQEISMFLNEGIALPHCRLADLSQPLIALGVTQSGVSDAPTNNKISAVLLLLIPDTPDSPHLQLLAAASQLFQSHGTLRLLNQAHNPEEIYNIVRTLE
jgi:mannitol/fructose-specific phosphotransferase system IIA component (Ntr-type)